MLPTTILCLGLSYRTAPVELRERLGCSLADVQPNLPTATAVKELVLLSTCNRIELYAAAAPAPVCPRTELMQLLARTTGLAPEAFAADTYTYADEEAMHHLLRVASGLDSLVLGEPQILGQVTDAYMTAVAAHTTGPILDALFKTAIRTGKRARTETAISSNPASVSSVAINLAQQILGDLSTQRVLVVGAGEMGQAAVKALHHRGLTRVDVANRTLARAQSLVAAGHGRAYSLGELGPAIAAADVVISAAAMPQPIIGRALLAGRERPLVLVDIAVPRNVDTAVAGLPGVHLFDVDDLQTTLDESLAARQAEVPHIEAIIAVETQGLYAQLRELSIKPVIVEMRRKAEQIRETELERTLRYLRDVDPEVLAHIHHFSRSLVNKLLHEPTVRLKEKASDNQAGEYAHAVRELFGLRE